MRCLSPLEVTTQTSTPYEKQVLDNFTHKDTLKCYGFPFEPQSFSCTHYMQNEKIKQLKPNLLIRLV